MSSHEDGVLGSLGNRKYIPYIFWAFTPSSSEVRRDAFGESGPHTSRYVRPTIDRSDGFGSIGSSIHRKGAIEGVGRASSGSGGIVMSNEIVGIYAGDVDPAEAWASLASDPRSVLVDVRTRAEWSFVGLPTLASLGKQPITLEWAIFPSMSANPDFVEVLDHALSQAGFGKETRIFFLCRSGHRSRFAAAAMTAVGWTGCFNITEGFEGGLDGEAHRGRVAGWKARGLPWSQT